MLEPLKHQLISFLLAKLSPVLGHMLVPIRAFFEKLKRIGRLIARAMRRAFKWIMRTASNAMKLFGKIFGSIISKLKHSVLAIAKKVKTILKWAVDSLITIAKWAGRCA